jgi:hypothetical protein
MSVTSNVTYKEDTMTKFKAGVTFGLVVLALVGAVSAAPSASTLVSAQPNNVVFHAMTWAGLRAFAGLEKRVPRDLAELRLAGYVLYETPSGNKLQYSLTQGGANLSTSAPLTRLGKPAGTNTALVKVTNDPPVVWKQTPFFNSAARKWETRNVMRETFPGGELIANGVNKEEVKTMLHAARLQQHLLFLAQEYHASTGSLPRDLATLEAFQGAARVPAGWQGIELAGSAGQVSVPNSLFAGLVSNYQGVSGQMFLVKAQLGSKIREAGIYVRNGQSELFGVLSY